MNSFIHQYERKVTGNLNGFDRLVVRGTLRALSYTAGMMSFLYDIGVLLKDFGAYVEQTSHRVREASYEAARRLNRPVLYLTSSRTGKEPLARKIMQQERITEGLICLLRCVEPCMSYEIRRDRESKKLVLEKRHRKCLHLYHYWVDPVFGFMSGRLQTWFPFEVQICLNGREWLSRQMDRVGMSYSRQENGFLWVEDFPAAQELMDEQVRFAWAPALELVACRLNPVHEEIFRRYPVEYYWSVHQSEWASDLVFRSSQALAEIYPQLVRSGIGVFSSPDVMRFLGKRLHPNFSGEIISDYKNRPEGIRVKHRVGANAVKMYDKFGRILRVETTLNDPKPFKVFRPLEGNPQGRHAWRPMRKGIADLARRAEISQACNDRYLEALAALRTDRPIQQLIDPVCRTVAYKGRRERALRPWEPADQRLLQVISRGEFCVNGVRNRDLLPYLFPEAASSAEERRRASARVTRKLRLLRAHGIIRKVAKTHRYLFTKKGRRIATAILEYQKATLEQLSELAA